MPPDASEAFVYKQFTDHKKNISEKTAAKFVNTIEFHRACMNNQTLLDEWDSIDAAAKRKSNG